jgi:hypothetical protein
MSCPLGLNPARIRIIIVEQKNKESKMADNDSKVSVFPQEVLESVAKVLYDRELFQIPFRDASAHIRNLYLSRAQDVLEPAAIHLSAEVAAAWDEGVIYGHNNEGRLIDKRAENPFEKGK